MIKNLRALFRNHSDKLVFVFLIMISSVLIVNSDNQTIQVLNKSGQTFFAAFQVGVSGLSGVVARLFGTLDDVGKLSQEVADLKKQLSDYKQLNELKDMLEQENQQLRSALNMGLSIPKIFQYNVREIPALIIAKEPGNFFQSLIINRGSKDGIHKDMAVIAEYEKGFGLVGKIVSVSVISSIVMPIYNKDFYASAQLKTSQYEGLVSGLGENSQDVLMQFVSKNAKSHLKIHDVVITSGTGQVYPKGIHIGTINEISSNSYETSMELQLHPVVDFARLQTVFVIDMDKSYLGGLDE
ncbi:MAG: rod shape-determining protein MreC [Spirochaetales bacterium]|nr:rod shape-determining protein MreC [Spirochaetales bacterium]